jgi:hypothetical protein
MLGEKKIVRAREGQGVTRDVLMEGYSDEMTSKVLQQVVK